MKKRFNFGRLGAVALSLTLITTCLMGGTLAKYTSEVSGTAGATVAKWAVNFSDGTDNYNKDFTIKLADIDSNKNNVSGENKIAPGSAGMIPIVIDATGNEVTATLSYTIDKSSIGSLPIEFYTDENYKTAVTWDNENKITESKEIAAGAAGDDAKLTKNLYWKWNTTGENIDSVDTGLGTAATPATGTISITLKAEQKVITPETPAS